MNIKMWQKAGLLSGLLLLGAGYWPGHADNAKAVPAPQGKIVEFPLDIKFDTDKADIKAGQHNEAEFKKLSAELSNYPYAKVEIEGYADTTGTAEFNQRLSVQRAQAVRQRFIDRYGITADRIDAVGFGETKPVATNETASGRMQNRRVIARIIRLESEKTPTNGNHI